MAGVCTVIRTRAYIRSPLPACVSAQKHFCAWVNPAAGAPPEEPELRFSNCQRPTAGNVSMKKL